MAPSPGSPLHGVGDLVPRPARIAGIRRETADVYSMDLEPPGGTGFTFRPGQFNMLYLFGESEAAISISGDPARRDRLVHTIRAVGAVTRGLGRLEAGDTIGVRGPFGRPWPTELAAGRDVIVMAGGVGLAPLRPLLFDLAAHRDQYGRISLLYGTRTPADVLFADQLETWRGQGLDVETTVDAAAPGWHGNVGAVTTLVPGARFAAAHASAFICGPEIMMRYATHALLGRGVPADRIFLSMERNMKCAIGTCGHCQFGPAFVCRDGPVFPYERLAPWIGAREL